MAQISYRANLSARAFPFVSTNWGRSVIVSQYDQNFNRQVTSQEDSDKDVGIPQIYYCHNVMPHQQGFQSIGYKDVLPVNTAAAADPVVEIFYLRDAAGTKVWIQRLTSGLLYYSTGSTWVIATGATAPAGKRITTAFVSGVHYMCIAPSTWTSGTPAVFYTFNFDLTDFNTVTPTALDLEFIAGISAASGYLIAYGHALVEHSFGGTTTLGSPDVEVTDPFTQFIGRTIDPCTEFPTGAKILSLTSGGGHYFLNMDTNAAVATFLAPMHISAVAPVIYWSSTLDPLDFTPSLSTGAGSGAPEGVTGEIASVRAHVLGFFIFTSDNVVAAFYSGNSRFPFNFREVVGSAGIEDEDDVVQDSNSGNFYAYTYRSGLQLISSSQSQVVLPEVTDFLSGKLFEDYNESTDTFTQTALTSTMARALAVVSDRYLVFSYGISSFTHALVYDLIDRRWGKLKVDHVRAFEFVIPDPDIAETARGSLAFLKVDGSVSTVDFSTTSTTSSGVIALGKYQFVRPRTLQLDEVAFENATVGGTLTAYALPALDGKNFTKQTLGLLETSGQFRKYGSRAVGTNISLLFKGAFSLVSLVLTFNIHGKR